MPGRDYPLVYAYTRPLRLYLAPGICISLATRLRLTRLVSATAHRCAPFATLTATSELPSGCFRNSK